MAGGSTQAECPGSMGAARRAKRRQAQAAVEGKLVAAYAAVARLEKELEMACQAMGSSELARRLLLVAPALQALLVDEVPSKKGAGEEELGAARDGADGGGHRVSPRHDGLESCTAAAGAGAVLDGHPHGRRQRHHQRVRAACN